MRILRKIADDLHSNEQLIIERNMRDVAAAERKKIDPTLLQRLRLKPAKIRTLVQGIRAIADQDEPLRKVIDRGFKLSDIRVQYKGFINQVCESVHLLEDGTEAIVAEAHKFLQEQGCINIGVPHGEPAEEEQPVEEGVSDEDLQTAVFEFLQTVDITVRQPDFISSALHRILPGNARHSWDLFGV